MKYRLRTPTRDDVHQLAALGRDTFLETFGHLYSDEDKLDYVHKVYSPEAIQLELDNPRLQFQIIDSGVELLGYAKIGEVRVPVSDKRATDRELRQLYVRAGFQGMKLGRELMAWAFEQFELQEATAVYLSVFSDNPRAIRFYQSYGFEKIGEYGFPVGQHVDREWIMALRSPEANIGRCFSACHERQIE